MGRLFRTLRTRRVPLFAGRVPAGSGRRCDWLADAPGCSAPAGAGAVAGAPPSAARRSRRSERSPRSPLWAGCTGSAPSTAACGCRTRRNWSAPNCCWSSSTHPDGQAAPRLVQTRPDPAELRDLWRQLVEALSVLARAGLAHGDLSPYKVLVHEGALVLIDLPQVVDIVINPQGPAFLARDVAVTGKWFAARGLDTDADTLLANLLADAGLR